MNKTKTPITWDPACYPTADEWRDWFLRCTEAEQITLAAQVVSDAQRAHTCFLMDHDGHLSALQAAMASQARERNARILQHEAETPTRGHDDACCTRADLATQPAASEGDPA